MKTKKTFDAKTSRPFNHLAREQMKLKLLADVKMDMMICEIEGWDVTEYLEDLKNLLNSIGKK